MSELLAMSFDSDATPRIQFEKNAQRQNGGMAGRPRIHGWGVGWYPDSEGGSSVLKDPGSNREKNVGQSLTEWDRFRSTLFLCHMRGHRRRRSQQDLQPFVRSYGGRQWILAHAGDFDRGWAERLPLGDDPAFEPLGRTDSEHGFCWLLTQLHGQRGRKLSDVPPEMLHGWLRELNQCGQLSLIVSDGDLLAVYNDALGRNDLFWSRLIPPHATRVLESDAIRVDLDAPEDPNRTLLAFSSVRLSTDDWRALAPGQLVLARRGSVVWDSEPRALEGDQRQQQQQGAVPAPAPAIGGPEEAAHQQAALENRVPPGVPTLIDSTEERVLEVEHDTLYTYQHPVERSTHRFLLAPVHDRLQHVESHELRLNLESRRTDYEDVFGNQATMVEIDDPYTELRVTSRSRVRLRPPDSIESRSRRETIPLVWMPWQRQMLSAYLLPTELPETQLEELSAFAMSFVERNDSELIGALLDLNETIFRDFTYQSGSTTAASTPFEVYQSRRGVCQDFANLMMCIARLLNVPARYRMGYVFTGSDYTNTEQGDASHAWIELYIPRVGWHGFDPTNGRQTGTDHVRVACGRNHRDATPTTGTIYRGGGTETLRVNVRVTDVS